MALVETNVYIRKKLKRLINKTCFVIRYKFKLIITNDIIFLDNERLNFWAICIIIKSQPQSRRRLEEQKPLIVTCKLTLKSVSEQFPVGRWRHIRSEYWSARQRDQEKYFRNKCLYCSLWIINDCKESNNYQFYLTTMYHNKIDFCYVYMKYRTLLDKIKCSLNILTFWKVIHLTLS